VHNLHARGAVRRRSRIGQQRHCTGVGRPINAFGGRSQQSRFTGQLDDDLSSDTDTARPR